jgi:hypothetical protein
MVHAQSPPASRRSWSSVLIPTIAALWASEWGCGGIVEDSRQGADAGHEFSGSGGGPKDRAGGNGGGRITPVPPIATCGDGVVNDGEQCDGAAFRSGMSTCGEATAGAEPYGTLSCTPTCGIDFSGCMGRGTGGFPPGAGSAPVGGSFGIGGGAGTMGFPPSPADDCYARGGVPDPMSSENCSFGADAVNACITKRPSTTCADKCGCSVCANQYDHCKTDGACFWMLTCAEAAPCYSVAACEGSCPDMIKSAGGPNTSSARLLDSLLACVSAGNCPLNCN